MHRRITLSQQFQEPDAILREAIWQKHIPSKLQLCDDVDLRALAEEYEISGGFIKNAVVTALSLAVARCGSNEGVVVTMEEMRRACQLQVRGHLQASELERRVIPKVGLKGVVLPADALSEVRRILDYEKARKVTDDQRQPLTHT